MELILHVVHIAGIRMIESGIDALSIWNNLRGITRRVKPLKHIPVNVEAVERLSGLEAWMKSWWVLNLKKFQPGDCFELQGDNFLWAIAPSSAETVIELFLENCMQHHYRSHLIVVPRIMTLCG